MKCSHGETHCYFSAHESGARLMNAFTLKSLHINNPALAGRPVSQPQTVIAHTTYGSLSVLMYNSVLHRFWGGLWLISTILDASSAACACVWAMCPGVCGKRAIPPPCSGFIWCGRGQSEELFPGTYPALLLP